MTDEEFVRANWELVHRCDGSYGAFARGVVLVQDVRNHWRDCASWAAAAEFTYERLEQIRQLGRQRDWMAAEFSNRECLEHVECVRKRAIQARTLALLESALADLRRGMRSAPQGCPESDSND